MIDETTRKEILAYLRAEREEHLKIYEPAMVQEHTDAISALEQGKVDGVTEILSTNLDVMELTLDEELEIESAQTLLPEEDEKFMDATRTEYIQEKIRLERWLAALEKDS
jgi:hypothetical protein